MKWYKIVGIVVLAYLGLIIIEAFFTTPKNSKPVWNVEHQRYEVSSY